MRLNMGNVMYTPEQLMDFGEEAVNKGLPTYRVDYVECKGEKPRNFAIKLLSYQEAACMADTCLNDGCYSVTVSKE